jgi:hypothetical protein
MLALNRSLLNKEYILMSVLKTLASIICMCNLHAILLSIKYWKTSVCNTVFFSARFYCALLTLHVSAPFGGHLEVLRTVLRTEVFQYLIDTRATGCITQLLRFSRQTKHLDILHYLQMGFSVHST